ncbi:leukocyte tyrosine kinase receptor [Ambystoma mexicanum]|uniref:leukocyte tyrosine kinase receptor n=1 Tax=Ambystoma mexicanum TaxID=8296 RepID=UPI0037E865CF
MGRSARSGAPCTCSQSTGSRTHVTSPLQLLFWASTLVAVSGFGSNAIEDITSPRPPSPGASQQADVTLEDHLSSAEYSCNLESDCPWTSSRTDNAEPHWERIPPGALTGQHEDLLLGDSASPGDMKGGLLLLNTSLHAGQCEFRLSSPLLPWSSAQCLLEMDVYSPPGAMPGRLTVQVVHMKSNSTTKVAVKTGGGAMKRETRKLLTADIGQVDAPFQISVAYSSCGVEKEEGLLAFNSLRLSSCFRDEEGPDLSRCTQDSSFYCTSGACISRLQVCDFHLDCPGGEDEGDICASLLPEGAFCSFESGACDWAMDDAAATASWSIVDSKQTDPEAPVLGSALKATAGHFLYLRVQDQWADGTARAYSANLPGVFSSQDCQVKFSVHIFGAYNGTVSLAVLEKVAGPTGSAQLVWERTASWGDRWFPVNLQLPELRDGFQLVLQASWGWGSLADIAVDNITVTADCFHEGRRHGQAGKHQFAREVNRREEPQLTPLPDPSASGATSDVEWWFTACGASGPRGPTQAQCDNAYRNTNVSVTMATDGALQGVQIWRVPATNIYRISAYGAAGGKGLKNHNKRSHGVFISADFRLQKDELLYILVGQQGEDACPGGNVLTRELCLGESSITELEYYENKTLLQWAGGGGGGGGASYIFKLDNGVFRPLLIAAGGGGKAYLEDPKGSSEQAHLEEFEKSIAAPGVNGRAGAAGGGGGWNDSTLLPRSGKSLMEGAEGGKVCPQASANLHWTTSGGFGGGGGACTSGGGGGGYKGGHASEFDDLTTDGEDGISFMSPAGEIFLQPLAAMESHGEVQIEVFLNCNHCVSGNCKRDPRTKLVTCICKSGELLASDNINCTEPDLEEHFPIPLILSVVTATVILGVIFTCGGLSVVYHRKKQQLEGARIRLQSSEYKLSKIRTSTIMTDYNPNYCFAGKAATLSELKEIPRKNISLLRALGHGAFGEVYEGTVVGMAGDPNPLQVAIKTLPEISSEQDEMDFLMEALIISKFSHQNIVRCVGVSLQTLPRFILLELMAGGDMKSFLRQNRPRVLKPSSLTMLDLLNMARDIACGSKYLEDNHFIHRDIAARNCLLTCGGQGRVAKIGDFGMARDIYRASYYRKGGRAMLPVKWMPPEAFLEGIFTSKTDTWSFGVLLWEIFSLGYMPYPCKTNQEVLEFVTSGGRMDPPKNCPGPVYRIMTQCWQHSPEYRPDFTTILERIKYCTQDPDVVNTELPVECSPAPEEEGSAGMRPAGSSGMTPLVMSPSLTQQLVQRSPEAQRLGPKIVECPQELIVDSLGGWAVQEPSLPCLSDSTSAPWFQQNSSSIAECTLQTAQRLTNKNKNLWNPTYGSLVMDSACRSSQNTNPKPTVEQEDSGFDGNCSSSPSSRASPNRGQCAHLDIGGIELVKLQNFPCGNVNYAYDDLCFEMDGASAVDTRDRTAVLRSASLCGEGLVLRKQDKPPGERDSGLSLSEDLSLTPV